MTIGSTGCIFHTMKKFSESEKAAISKRLVRLAEEKESSEGDGPHGRYARIYRFLEMKGVSVSQQSIRKWFSAQAVPSIEYAKLLADYYRSSYLWILHGEGASRTAVDAVTKEQVPVYFLPLLYPSQLDAWKDGTLTDPIHESVEVFENFGAGAFAFTIIDNSLLPYAAKGMKAVVETDAREMSDPVTSRRFVVVLDDNQFFVGEYSKTPYPTITPPNTDFRPIELSRNHRVVGILAALAQHKFSA